ncbi:F-box protein PP2-B11, partial [Mucuna pruriens]
MEIQGLPEGCVACIIAFTTPLDVCRVALVSKIFRSAADSDAVWERFLPSDYHSIVSLFPSLLNYSSKKTLYLALSDRPIIIEQGKKSFQLDRKSGNKCFMLAARSLFIVWGDNEEYWNWITDPDSRFPEVVELLDVCWLEIRGVINTLSLSPNTRYAAYLVFKMINAMEFDKWPVELSVSIFGGHDSTKNVCLYPKIKRPNRRVRGLQCPNVRGDGWLEIEMGEFFSTNLEEAEVQMSVKETKSGNWKKGLFLEGIEGLPEGCVACIIALTTPLDACRVSLVSKIFRSAADSDAVWERFLPSDYHSIISLFPSPLNYSSKKTLYLALSDRPIIIKQGRKSFQLDRKSGNKCYMLAARSLVIVWGDSEEYWNWTTDPDSRFPEVAELLDVCWLEIRGAINTLALSPNTRYGAYLVFKMINANGFDKWPVELSVSIFGSHDSTKNVCLYPNVLRPNRRVQGLQCPNVRGDGWLEIEMGEFFNTDLEEAEVQMSVKEIKGGHWKKGLFLEGIEVRPKGCIANVLSFTSPRDVCRLSSVSPTFRSAAESDAVWDKFLPADYHAMLSECSSLCLPSKKHLYLRLCQKPLLIDDGKKSFQLDKIYGKKCYMLSARVLFIVWGDTPRYWRWTSLPDARFSEVAELVSVCWLEIRGWMNTGMLSPKTLYGAYLVFKSNPAGTYGFDDQSVEVTIGIGGGDTRRRTVFLDSERGRRLRYQIVPRRTGIFNRARFMATAVEPPTREETNIDLQYPKKRDDGWLEVELGDFFNQGEEDKEVEMVVSEIKS